jgi:hypothetical protein
LAFAYRRLLPTLALATDPADRGKQAWASAGLTFQGLKALGVPQDALDSFPSAFQQGGVAVSGAAGSAGAATTPQPRVPQLMLMLDTESGFDLWERRKPPGRACPGGDVRAGQDLADAARVR